MNIWKLFEIVRADQNILELDKSNNFSNSGSCNNSSQASSSSATTTMHRLVIINYGCFLSQKVFSICKRQESKTQRSVVLFNCLKEDIASIVCFLVKSQMRGSTTLMCWTVEENQSCAEVISEMRDKYKKRMQDCVRQKETVSLTVMFCYTTKAESTYCHCGAKTQSIIL